MKYVLVQWSAGSIKTSILTENYVRDKSMLYDFTKEGIISFVTVQRGEKSVVKNKGKLGRIACVSGECFNRETLSFFPTSLHPCPTLQGPGDFWIPAL